MFKKSLAIAILLGAACIGPNAYAQTSANSSLSGVSYQLIDLDPNDGVTPSVDFTRFSQVISVAAPGPGQPMSLFDYNYSVDSQPGIHSFLAAPFTTTSALVDGSDVGAHGATLGTFDFYSSASQTQYFSLSAHTQLIVTGHATADVGHVQTMPDWTNADVSLVISDNQQLWPVNQRVAYVNGAYSYNYGPRALSDDFSLTFTNNDGAALDGRIDLNASVGAHLQPVPEPQMFGMLLAGMALLGCARLRRQR